MESQVCGVNVRSEWKSQSVRDGRKLRRGSPLYPQASRSVFGPPGGGLFTLCGKGKRRRPYGMLPRAMDAGAQRPGPDMGKAGSLSPQNHSSRRRERAKSPQGTGRRQSDGTGKGPCKVANMTVASDPVRCAMHRGPRA